MSSVQEVGPFLQESAVLGTSPSIHTLPAELLVFIFRLILGDLSQDKNPTKLVLTPTWLQLVCKRWNELVLGTPSLWTSIYLYDYPFDEEGMISCYVARSRTSKLSVVAGSYHPRRTPLLTQVGTYLGEEALRRVQHLHAGYTYMTKQGETFLNLMETAISLTLVPADILPDAPLIDDYHIDIPSLRHLSAQNTDLNLEKCSFDSLESLHMAQYTERPNAAVHGWTRGLSRFPFLQAASFDLQESIDIRFDPDAEPDEDEPAFAHWNPRPPPPLATLVNLRSLTLHQIYPYHLQHVIATVEMPNLKKLEVMRHGSWSQEDWSHLPHSRWRLEEITLTHWCDSEALLKHFTSRPETSSSLQVLHVRLFNQLKSFILPPGLRNLHTVRLDGLSLRQLRQIAEENPQIKTVIFMACRPKLDRDVDATELKESYKWLKGNRDLDFIGHFPPYMNLRGLEDSVDES